MSNNKYWENEKPVEVTTSKNVLRFFKEAGKLQISNPSWTNAAGEVKQGKTVTLDLSALSETPEGRSFIAALLKSLKIVEA